MYAMEFGNPEFHEGLNVTVRYGNKWANRVAAGSHLILIPAPKAPWGDPSEKTAFTLQRFAFARAQVVFVHSILFKQIPDVWLRFEHDPRCRTRQGIFEEMVAVYGDDFQADSEVTVVGFAPGR